MTSPRSSLRLRNPSSNIAAGMREARAMKPDVTKFSLCVYADGWARSSNATTPGGPSTVTPADREQATYQTVPVPNDQRRPQDHPDGLPATEGPSGVAARPG